MGFLDFLFHFAQLVAIIDDIGNNTETMLLESEISGMTETDDCEEH